MTREEFIGCGVPMPTNTHLEANGERTVLVHVDILIRGRFYTICHFRLPIHVDFSKGRYTYYVSSVASYVQSHYSATQGKRVEVTSNEKDPIYGLREFSVLVG